MPFREAGWNVWACRISMWSRISERETMDTSLTRPSRRTAYTCTGAWHVLDTSQCSSQWDVILTQLDCQVLFTWHHVAFLVRPRIYFLDKFCVHQGDDDLKRLGGGGTGVTCKSQAEPKSTLTALDVGARTPERAKMNHQKNLYSSS